MAATAAMALTPVVETVVMALGVVKVVTAGLTEATVVTEATEATEATTPVLIDTTVEMAVMDTLEVRVPRPAAWVVTVVTAAQVAQVATNLLMGHQVTKVRAEKTPQELPFMVSDAMEVVVMVATAARAQMLVQILVIAVKAVKAAMAVRVVAMEK